MRFFASILQRTTARGNISIQPDGKVSRFCSLGTVAVLLAVPALRLYQARLADIAHLAPIAETAGVVSSLSAGLSNEPIFTAGEIQNKAMPLLTQLAPVSGKPLVIRGMIGRTDSTTQREWTVVYCYVPPDAAAEGTAPDRSSPDPAEVGYDADTGELTFATTVCDLDGHPYVPGSKREHPLTAQTALGEARSWLRKLSLAAGQTKAAPAPVVFAPQKSTSGTWRVWLQGRETPEGPPLTVLVTLSSQTEALMRAVVVDRAAIPSLYLPRR